MSANVLLGTMVAVSVLAVATSSHWERPAPPPFQRTAPETPWLTPELAARVVGPEGGLGPLFQGVELGGPAPSTAVRSHIAEFARAHNVDIDLEIAHDTLTAIRFEVMYGGCCGYEAADVLATRLDRPHFEQCCGCGDSRWIDDWTYATAGVYARARVRVNRVIVRWEHELRLGELIELAESLVGRDRVSVAAEAGERWRETEPSRTYQLDVPYAFRSYSYQDEGLGIEISVGSGRIVAVKLPIRENRDAEQSNMMDTLRARLGRPQLHRDNTWTWRTRTRTVIADFEWPETVTVRTR